VTIDPRWWPIRSCIEAEPAVQERQLHAAFHPTAELGFQREVRPPEVVAVAAVRRRLVLQCRPVGVGSRVFPTAAYPRRSLPVRTGGTAGNASEKMKLDR